MKARNFEAVYNQILKLAPPALKKELEDSVGFWAPEVVWYNLSRLVMKHIEYNSSNPNSIAIYAVLCDCTQDEIKARFKMKGV